MKTKLGSQGFVTVPCHVLYMRTGQMILQQGYLLREIYVLNWGSFEP